MPAYCTSCFRDLRSEDAQCHCRRVSAPPSRAAVVLGLLIFAIVLMGVLTLDARLCIAGAAIGVIALAIHLVRRF